MARIKKSVEEALERAEALSREHPAQTFWVMDKPCHHAVVVGADFVHRERVLEHWDTVAVVRGGVVVRAG